ncbi:MAG TPA: hypothetical protein VMA83_05360 [Solirubrobacteraceae bacterium]|nr:hypothetical protein [Solirubrobacteraceae bacterium]
MRRLAAIAACVMVLAPAPALAASTVRGPVGAGSGTAAELAAGKLVGVAIGSGPVPGWHLTSARAVAIARRQPAIRQTLAEHPHAYPLAYLKGGGRWQIGFYAPYGGEVGQVIIDDRDGRAVETWTGVQVAWTMARGYRGAFGEHVTALYVWLPLCVLFLAPFVRLRRPFALINVDLLALLSLSLSLAFFDRARISASVPLAYPPLLYLLGRMLWLVRRRSRPADVRIRFGPRVLTIGLIFLVAFRVALNVTDGNVIDVGYAGVIGAQRIVEGRSIYGTFPTDNEHGDTYGPVAYEAYVPFEQLFGWSGTWNDLPAAHAAALFFDLLAIALVFWLGRRVRGPTFGLAMAWAWAAFPFTLYALESDSNDTLVAVLVLAALVAATYRPPAATFARGLFAALAALAKFAPLALVPVLWTHGVRESARRARVLALFAAGLVAGVALAFVPLYDITSLRTLWQRTIEYQAARGAPFSLWGLYHLHFDLRVAEALAAALALALALVPRRDDIVGLCAACAAILIAVELALEYWFYLYIPWFFAPAMLALLAAGRGGQRPANEPASESARSRSPAAALST